MFNRVYTLPANLPLTLYAMYQFKYVKSINQSPIYVLHDEVAVKKMFTKIPKAVNKSGDNHLRYSLHLEESHWE